MEMEATASTAATAVQRAGSVTAVTAGSGWPARMAVPAATVARVDCSWATAATAGPAA